LQLQSRKWTIAAAVCTYKAYLYPLH